MRIQKSRTLKWHQSGEERRVELPLEGCAWSLGDTIRSLGILLHGYGDESENFLSCGQEFAVPGVLWVALDAPFELPQRMSLGSGRMWFDLFHDPAAEIARSEERLTRCVELLLEACGLPLSRMFLLGFSQGAFMALRCGLKGTLGGTPAAVVALSGFLMGAHHLPRPSERAARIPLFLGHGAMDQVVLPLWHFETIESLGSLGYTNLKSKVYPVAHSLHHDEIADVRAFLNGVL